ncbi:hypothetical protein Hanom_Chr01g00057071 [Helianthus anomalus]
MAMKWCKLPQRPKTRAKIIQRTLLAMEVEDRCVITHVQDNHFRSHVSKKRGRHKGCVKNSLDDTSSGNKKKLSVEEATSDSVLVENVEGSVTLSRVVRKCYVA